MAGTLTINTVHNVAPGQVRLPEIAIWEHGDWGSGVPYNASHHLAGGMEKGAKGELWQQEARYLIDIAGLSPGKRDSCDADEDLPAPELRGNIFDAELR